ncbi:AEC family transporter [Agrilactobacillus yilanensis]|uniref:AEC family transporter n=1 Tax=Agrilactobacillus yilanensis TaxID=2485997 RepID=A0ABW4J3V8_9LACO|nr:AEC family transporter [Agrilactobacillus yilanensis]
MTLSGLANQIALMFILMAVGFVINKLHLMHEQTSDDLTNILLMIIGPCLIIKAFRQTFSASRLHELLFLGLAVLMVYAVAAILAGLIFKRVKNKNLQRIAIYSSVYPNVGFLGIPLAGALFGTQGVFYAVVSMAVFNIFNWSHGVSLFRTQQTKQTPWAMFKQIMLNPNIIAIIIGLIIFIGSIQLPSILSQAINYISDANTPLSMIIVGNSLAKLRFNRDALNLPILVGLSLRNLIFPIIAFYLMTALGVQGMGLSVSLLLAACPAASLGVLFTLQAHQDASPAISLMSLSTLMSLITIPIVFAIT